MVSQRFFPLTVFLLAAGLVLTPGEALARLVFGFLPAAGTAETAEVQRDLLSRLERTRWYSLFETEPSASLPEACAHSRKPDKVARLAVTKGKKYEGAVEVFDCATNSTDPPKLKASSGKLSNLAGGLRADFLAQYPFLALLEIERGRSWASAGKEEKIFPGSYLYSYAEEAPRQYRLLGRFWVKSYHEASFRSELAEDFRVPGAPAPATGEILSPKRLVESGPRALVRPVLSGITARRRLPARVLLPSFDPRNPVQGAGLRLPSGAHELGFPEEREDGTGESLELRFTKPLPAGTILRWRFEHNPRTGESGYEAVLESRRIVLRVRDGKKPPRELAEVAVAGLPSSLELITYGPWAELYGDSRFLGGFEDFSFDSGTAELESSKELDLSSYSLYEVGPSL